MSAGATFPWNIRRRHRVRTSPRALQEIARDRAAGGGLTVYADRERALKMVHRCAAAALCGAFRNGASSTLVST